MTKKSVIQSTVTLTLSLLFQLILIRKAIFDNHEMKYFSLHKSITGYCNSDLKNGSTACLLEPEFNPTNGQEFGRLDLGHVTG